jgi:hypothetical protein
VPGGMFPYMYIPTTPPPPVAREKKPQPLQPHPKAQNLPLGDTTFFCIGFPDYSPPEFIMQAAVKGDIDWLRRLLAQAGNLPDFANSYGITPLMAAAAHGHTDIVNLLASHPLTDINRTCKADLTALHYAAHWGRSDCLRALMRNGADFSKGHVPAYLYAADAAVEEAFRENKKCAQHMAAAVKASEEKPVAVENTEVKAPTKKEFSFEDILVFDKDRNAKHTFDVKEAAKRFVAFLPDLDQDDLNKFVTFLRTDKAFCDLLPWTHIFVEAARSGNVLAVIMIDEILNGPQSCMLENALAAVIEAGDDRHMAHVLLHMGAKAGDRRSFLPAEMGDPPEKFRLYQRALLLERGGILEEMVLWSDGLSGLGEKEIAQALQVNRAAKTERALRVCAEKIKVKACKPSFLRIAFIKAVEEGRFESMMAIYAESCHDRFFRAEKPLLSLDQGILRSAFILALKNERHDFALKMLADGYSPMGKQSYPQDKEFWAMENVSTKSKTIFRDAVSGSIKLTPLTPAYTRKTTNNIFLFPMPGMM